MRRAPFLKPIEEPPLPLRRRDAFASTPVDHDGGGPRPPPNPPDPAGEPVELAVRVYVAGSVRRALVSERAFSLEVEEGGFLFGRVYRDEEAPEHHLVEVTHAVPGEHTGASLHDLTFTGESFASMRRRLHEMDRDVRLVGWYHTHLSHASPPFGLSAVDLHLHFTTFRIPWQIAGLVNIEAGCDPEGRVLRFYVRQGRTMVRCPEEVLR